MDGWKIITASSYNVFLVLPGRSTSFHQLPTCTSLDLDFAGTLRAPTESAIFQDRLVLRAFKCRTVLKVVNIQFPSSNWGKKNKKSAAITYFVPSLVYIVLGFISELILGGKIGFD